MRIASIVVLLAACGGPTPTGTTGKDSGTTTTTGTTSAGTGTATGTGPEAEVGHLVFWSEEGGPGLRHQFLIGTFAPNFDQLAAPAICAARSELCVAELPATAGSYIDAVDSPYDAFTTQATWVGNEMDVGGHMLLFNVDASTGFGTYSKEISGSSLTALDVRLAGEWGEWTAPQVLPVGNYIDGLEPDPGSFLLANDGIDLSWTAGTGAGIVYVRVRNDDGFDRIWRFPDLGSAAIPASEITALTPGTQSDFLLYRVEGTTVHDANGNALTAESWSRATYLTAASDSLPTCKAILDANPSSQTGIYTIQPNALEPTVDVFCDMNTDGGGWTMVSSTTDPVQDKIDGWNINLTTLEPSAPMAGVWGGMRFPITGQSDIRFACKVDRTAPLMDVDLSFYTVGWYREVSTGVYDSASCFHQLDGWGAPPPPARRNNLTGETLPFGDQWNAGYLEGENTCDDTESFTVDFDDRGMDGNEVDGTDWGADDGFHKCGTVNNVTSGGAWYIFVRE